MVEEVKNTKLKEYLAGLPKNTPDTPYEITILGYKGKTLKSLAKVIRESARYVDLSSTVLDGLEDLDCGFTHRSGQPLDEGKYLVGAPKFTNCTATSAVETFSYCTNLKKVDTSGLENITKTQGMFKGCSKLTSIDLSGLKNIENAASMFSECEELTSITAPCFEKLTAAQRMFYSCSKLTSIDSSVFKKVKFANNMFSNCKSLTSIDTSGFESVRYADFMFRDCDNLDEPSKKAVAELIEKYGR